MNDSRLSVHIVTWNALTYLPAFFASLDEQAVPFRVVAVDNASTDGAAAWMTAERPLTTVLRNMRNMGFARGNNQAIQLALAGHEQDDLANRYVMLTNTDIEMHPACLERLVAFLDEHPEVDAAQPKLLCARRKPGYSDYPETERTDVIDSLGIAMTRARRGYNLGAHEKDAGQYDAQCDVFGPDGACAMFRLSSVLRVNAEGKLFDENFLAYKEDADLAWRMRRLGMRTVLIPQALAWHHRAAPSAQGRGWWGAWLARWRKPDYINYLSTRNHAWMLVKNLAWSDLLVHGFWIAPYEVAKMAVSLTSWSALRGYGAAVKGLPNALRERQKLNAMSKVQPKEVRRWFV